MDSLRIDGDDLTALGTLLLRTHDALDTEDLFTATLADAVGHTGLAQQIRDFTSSWNSHRTKLVEDLQWLYGATSTTNTAFSNVEGDLASALTTTTPSSDSSSQRGAAS